ncbi:MAG: hypothetical protein VYA77_08225, partial [Pseudomonadota bacterium]|nr:hypothetical protein [Pseudomonadota bacterium]
MSLQVEYFLDHRLDVRSIFLNPLSVVLLNHVRRRVADVACYPVQWHDTKRQHLTYERVPALAGWPVPDARGLAMWLEKLLVDGLVHRRLHVAVFPEYGSDLHLPDGFVVAADDVDLDRGKICCSVVLSL